ncbi:MAG TPA: ABC transporter permease, partial [Longimicrobiales bacterium]|nr:ABC transporter permease [Longimicrobiales bacterium]
MLEDVRRAIRTLVREPALSLVSVLTVALGTGAVAAVLGVHDAVLLRPPAVSAPAGLRIIDESRSGMTSQPVGVDAVPWARYKAYEASLSTVFSGLAAEHYGTWALASDEGAVAVAGYLVSGNYFGVLGVRPRVGGVFTRDDEPSVVLSDDLWRRRFGGDPGTVGRAVRIDGRAYTVVGVAPPDFHGTLHGLVPDVWIPLRAYDADTEGGTGPWVTFFGRLRPGVDDGRARAATEAAARSIPPFQPQTTVRGAAVEPLTGLPPLVR